MTVLLKMQNNVAIVTHIRHLVTARLCCDVIDFTCRPPIQRNHRCMLHQKHGSKLGFVTYLLNYLSTYGTINQLCFDCQLYTIYIKFVKHNGYVTLKIQICMFVWMNQQLIEKYKTERCHQERRNEHCVVHHHKIVRIHGDDIPFLKSLSRKCPRTNRPIAAAAIEQ